MPKSLVHKYVSAIADRADDTVVRPSDWNDDHNLQLGVRSVSIPTDTITDADHLSLIKYYAAGGVDIGVPDADNMLSGWTTTLLNCCAGLVTLSSAAGATFNGQPSIGLLPGDSVTLVSDGSIDYGAAVSTPRSGLVFAGLNLINGIIRPSVAANALTIRLVTWSNDDPSPANSVEWIDVAGNTHSITAPLSLVVPGGSAIGTIANAPARLWVAIWAADSTGESHLAVRNCLGPGVGELDAGAGYSVVGFPSNGFLSAVPFPGHSVHVNYSDVATTKPEPYKIVGVLDWSNPRTALPGQWTRIPDHVIQYNANFPKPGDCLQSRSMRGTPTGAVPGGTWVPTSLTDTIDPISTCNVIEVAAEADCFTYDASATGAPLTCAVALFRDAGTASEVSLMDSQLVAYSDYTFTYFSVHLIDWPHKLATYNLMISASADEITVPQTGGRMMMREIMS